MRLRNRVREAIVRAAVNVAVRRGQLTETQGKEVLDRLEADSWIEFFEWLLENWPEIMEMIMSIVDLFN